MQQWHKCPECGKDMIYGTNPCPYCKCFLAWSHRGPVLYIPPPEVPQQPSPVTEEQSIPGKDQLPKQISILSSKQKTVLISVCLLIVVALIAVPLIIQYIVKPSYSSRYTADQVLEIAKSNYPDTISADASWKTEYSGYGTWDITLKYDVTGDYYTVTWLFNESTGKLDNYKEARTGEYRAPVKMDFRGR
jgi:hypothetical protein